MVRAAMSGQSISFRARFRSAMNIWGSYRRGVMGNADSAINYHERLRDIYSAHVKRPIESSRMLEIGCGQLATQVALFQSAGATITGIDIEVPTYQLTPRILWRVVRENGWERGLKSLVRHVLYDQGTMQGVAKAAGRPVPFEHLDTRVMDACALELPSDSVDFVFSSAVFEHIADVTAAAREVNRVLKPDGVVWISTHLFPSLSGGHNLAWLTPDRRQPDDVPPWDHLRENRYPVNTYLNKLKLEDYRQIFGTELSVVQEELRTEGEALLTPALEDELKAQGYSRQDLLTRNLIICARKLES